MKTRIGFVGVGGIAQEHMQALAQLPNAEIVAVHDIDGERAAAAAQSFGAAVCGTAQEVLRSHKIDALYLCTPPFARNDLDVQAAERGIHLFAEKPLGLDLSAVIRKERLIRDSGIVHAAGYCLRYMDIVQRAKTYLSSKKVELISAYRFNGLHTPRWWRQLELSGGNFVDAATHQVDLIRYLVGEFDEVLARFERDAIKEADPEATIYDKGTVSFKLRNGAVGMFLDSCLMPHNPRSEVELNGHDFQLRINGQTLTIRDADGSVSFASETDIFLEQARRFLEAVENRRQASVLCDYSEALRTLAVTLAANRSAEERVVVKTNMAQLEEEEIA